MNADKARYTIFVQHNDGAGPYWIKEGVRESLTPTAALKDYMSEEMIEGRYLVVSDSSAIEFVVAMTIATV